MKKYELVFSLLAVWCLSSCAFLHSTQIGEVDSNIVSTGRKFEILVSEIGINIGEASSIAKGLTQDQKTREQVSSVQAIIELFQMGPRTGNPVFDPTYADRVFDLVREKCPSLRISGLMSIRESAKYPVVSGEIVKVVGYCSEG